MKYLKIILVNIFLILCILTISEFILFKQYQKNVPNVKYKLASIPYMSLLTKKDKFRAPSGLEYKKRPIILLGCSFAYGMYLKDNETISYKLSQISKRPVYNYAVQGKGLQNSLYILQHKIYDTKIKNPEYIIYIMMSDHIRRLYSNVCPDDFVGQPIYKFNKDGKLVLKSDIFPIYRQFYTFYYINNFIYNKFIANNFELNNRYINAYFKEMKRYIKLQYPDIKFVILIYGDKTNYKLDFADLQEDGFIVLQTEEISGVNLFERKYEMSDTDTHPVAAAWDIVAESLKNVLKL